MSSWRTLDGMLLTNRLHQLLHVVPHVICVHQFVVSSSVNGSYTVSHMHTRVIDAIELCYQILGGAIHYFLSPLYALLAITLLCIH